MCGICGTVALHAPFASDPRGTLARMNGSLVHRGPDDEGSYVDARAALAMRRLSIIDLSTGRQPIHNEDGSVQVVFNGEIYNFQGLRADLERKGHRFYTHSDTEVLVHLYEEEGDAFVSRLNGMFAFALWDSKRGRLLAARDRAGKKPFYYVLTPEAFLFASEPKALLAHPDVSRRIDPEALRRFLVYEYIPAPWSIWQGMKKLPAAHTLVLEGDQVRTAAYWDLAFDRDPEFPRDEAAPRLLAVLQESVRRRLVSDVPLGVFLSGGIDSSAVVGLMARLVDPRRIQTFSIGFREESFDESHWARLVANHFGTSHHEEILSADGMAAILPELATFFDEPFADSSIIPTYLLSKFTRRHVTVALGGDGGDELFLGYPPYQAHWIADVVERMPAFVTVAGRAVAARLKASFRDMSFDFRAKAFARGVGLPRGRRHQTWMAAFRPEELPDLLAPGLADVQDDVLAELDDRLAQRHFRHPIEQAAWLYFTYYLADDILAKVDRASMAASLEVRAPFLDPDVIDFASRVPIGWKMPRLRMKGLLKEAMRGVLPPEILARRKKGFGIPIAQWLAGPLRGMMESLLAPDRLGAQGVFRPEAVRRRIDEHLSHRVDHRKQLWALLVFQLWWDRCHPSL
ncbi:MAG: asparagine synthase (glutamine-hydrolyzing) [Planctomycetota bacterium]